VVSLFGRTTLNGCDSAFPGFLTAMNCLIFLAQLYYYNFFSFKKYEAVGFLPRHTQVGPLLTADFPLGHLILLKKGEGGEKKGQLPHDRPNKAPCAVPPSHGGCVTPAGVVPQNGLKRLQMEEL